MADKYQVRDCKLQRIHGKRANVFNYYGILSDNDGKTLDRQHYYCEVCYNKNKETPDCSVLAIKKFKTSTGTGNLSNHLYFKHQIQAESVPVTGEASIDNFVSVGPRKSGVSSAARKKELIDDLTIWFCQDLIPFNKIDSSGLREFLSKYRVVSSENEIPCSRSIATNGLKRIYSKCESDVKGFITCSNYSLAVDMWTDACRRMKYIGIILNFIKDARIFCINLGTISFPESHTSINIYTKIADICDKFALDITKAYIVRDNGANITASCRENGIKSHGCIGHGIHNLITVDGFRKVNNLVAIFQKMKEIHSRLRFKTPNIRAKNSELLNCSQGPPSTIIEALVDENDQTLPQEFFFESDFSDIAEEVVISSGEQLNDLDRGNTRQQTTLKAYCPTRWHSFLIMARSIMQNSKAINEVLAESDDIYLMLTGREIHLINELVNFLQKFKDIVDILSCGSAPTINKALLLRCELESLMERHDNDSQEINELKSSMKRDLDKRYPVTDLLIIASILDPKFKDLNVIHDYCEANFTSRKDLIKQFYTELIGEIDDVPSQIEETNGILTQLARKHSTRPGRETAFDLEIDSYLLATDERDVLVFWSGRKAAWPKLFALSTAILAIPATSVPVERLFSIAGLTLTKKRCQIAPEKLDKILFIHDNYKLFKK